MMRWIREAYSVWVLELVTFGHDADMDTDILFKMVMPKILSNVTHAIPDTDDGCWIWCHRLMDK